MQPTAYMMLGLPGSGKTTFSKKLAEELELSRYSLDEEYFDHVGNTRQAHRDFKVEKQVEEEIKKRLLGQLASGKSVVLDFCPWKYEERNLYRKLIESNGANCHIYYFDVPKDELLRRLEERNKRDDPTVQFMTPQMLKDFFERFDPPQNEVVEVIKQ